MPDDDIANDKLVLQELIDVLRKTDFVQIEVEYNGDGDDGVMDDVWLYIAGDTHGRLNGCGDGPKLDQAVRDQLIEFCWDVLETKQEGWENNEGAFGVFTFYLLAGTMLMEHKRRIIDIEESDYELSV